MTDKRVNHIVAAAQQLKEATSRDQTRRIKQEMLPKRQMEAAQDSSIQQANA